jgi:hypothetical protein
MSSKKKGVAASAAAVDDDDSTKNDDAIFEEYAPKNLPSKDTFVSYFLISLILSSAPAYLFFSVYDLSFPLIFFLSIPLTSLALTVSYQAVESAEFVKLSSVRKSQIQRQKKFTAAEAEKIQEETTAQESKAWAFLFTNSVYVISFLFWAFYALRGIDPLFSFVISSVLSAVTTWQLITAIAK